MSVLVPLRKLNHPQRHVFSAAFKRRPGGAPGGRPFPKAKTRCHPSPWMDECHRRRSARTPCQKCTVRLLGSHLRRLRLRRLRIALHQRPHRRSRHVRDHAKRWPILPTVLLHPMLPVRRHRLVLLHHSNQRPGWHGSRQRRILRCKHRADVGHTHAAPAHGRKTIRRRLPTNSIRVLFLHALSQRSHRAQPATRWVRRLLPLRAPHKRRGNHVDGGHRRLINQIHNRLSLSSSLSLSLSLSLSGGETDGVPHARLSSLKYKKKNVLCVLCVWLLSCWESWVESEACGLVWGESKGGCSVWAVGWWR